MRGRWPRSTLRRWRTALAGAALALSGEQAESQSLLGPRAAEIPMGQMQEQDRARVSLVRYATCLVQFRAHMVERVVEMYPGPEEWAAVSRLSTDDCLAQGQLRFPPTLMRGALFIALYRRDHAGAVPAPPAAPLDFAAVSHAPPAAPGLDTFVAMRAIADCVVRADPAAAHQAVLAAPVTPAETQAFSILLPHLSGCLPGGQQFRFNKLILAGLFAEVLYRDAAASQKAPN